MIDFLEMADKVVAMNASDIHLSTNNRPAYRLNGKIEYWNNEILEDKDVTAVIASLLTPEKYEEFLTKMDVDTAVTLENIGRFRVNAFKQRHGHAVSLRVISDKAPEMTDLNLPQSIYKILDLKDGLVLVTGPTGSGKSTTIASIINEFNKTKDMHIVTIEDPVEYIHRPKRCLINQREVGEDSVSYEKALRAALREDPDIILMGEIRDFESMSIALSAAETGHLVFSTLHTEGAAKTIDRLIDMFPSDEQMQALGRISTSLKAVISQRLLPRADKPGRVGAFEIMFVTSAISNLIRENKVAQIEQMIEISRGIGMVTKQRSIKTLLERGYIEERVAREYTFDIGNVDEILTGKQPVAVQSAVMRRG